MIYVITAMTKKGVIGKGNQLPWHIPEDLKLFKKITQGHPVIMGSKTYESIGRLLPNRQNIILGPAELMIPGADVCQSVQQALDCAREKSPELNIFIIGGAYTYAQFLPMADRLYISYIKHDYDGDVYFPKVDWPQWELAKRVDYPEFEFMMYNRSLDSRKQT